MSRLRLTAGSNRAICRTGARGTRQTAPVPVDDRQIVRRAQAQDHPLAALCRGDREIDRRIGVPVLRRMGARLDDVQPQTVPSLVLRELDLLLVTW
ncbi:MAG: hypothetical protein JXR37_07320 [Kiritimatiellae bacterium]|nr:hypothetical protein [Kiritimatiellia bacterium]